MIFSNKTFSIILFCGIALSSAYAIVAGSQHISIADQTPEIAVSPVDTNRHVKTKFPIKNSINKTT